MMYLAITEKTELPAKMQNGPRLRSITLLYTAAAMLSEMPNFVFDNENQLMETILRQNIGVCKRDGHIASCFTPACLQMGVRLGS